LCRPYGACFFYLAYPALPRWANSFRASGARFFKLTAALALLSLLALLVAEALRSASQIHSASLLVLAQPVLGKLQALQQEQALALLL